MVFGDILIAAKRLWPFSTKTEGNKSFLVYVDFYKAKTGERDEGKVYGEIDTSVKGIPSHRVDTSAPWMCADVNGKTGIFGVVVNADTEEDALKKAREIREHYLERDIEPGMW
jgi:hypothetical protein